MAALHVARWPAAVFLLACATAAVGVRWGTHAAGGSDSYGYVSQAHAWLHGGIPVDEPLVRAISVRDREWVASPLGWRPGRRAGEIVPVYPPGLPWLMALAMLLTGPNGPFLVSPALGALAIWCTFLVGRAVWSPVAGAIAAAALATNPTFLYQLVQPMSDVPVTALWTACLAALATGRAWGWAAGGLLAAIAVPVRPNLAPLAGSAVVFGIVATSSSGAPRPCLRQLVPRVVMFSIPVAAATAAVLWLNAEWYGSPFLSGYGSRADLFATSNIPANVSSYGRAIIETNPVLLPVAAFCAVSLAWSHRRRARVPGSLATLALWFGVVVGLYLTYVSFPAWWYTRFLLPGYPALMVLSSVAVVAWTERGRARRWIAALLVGLSFAGGVLIAIDRYAFDLRSAEAKYEAVGHAVRVLLPANAVALAMLHSGSVRFYGARPTLRWDIVKPADFDRLLAQLAKRGMKPYAVLDGAEHDAFLAQFHKAATIRDGRFGRAFSIRGVEVLALAE